MVTLKLTLAAQEAQHRLAMVAQDAKIAALTAKLQRRHSDAKAQTTSLKVEMTRLANMVQGPGSGPQIQTTDLTQHPR